MISGLGGIQALAPGGEMTRFRPPIRRSVSGIWIVSVWPSVLTLRSGGDMVFPIALRSAPRPKVADKSLDAGGADANGGGIGCEVDPLDQ